MFIFEHLVFSTIEGPISRTPKNNKKFKFNEQSFQSTLLQERKIYNFIQKMFSFLYSTSINNIKEYLICGLF